MAWQNRDYNSGDGSGSNFLGNPAAFLNFSIPFGTWFGARIRLHFWLLLAFLFTYVDIIWGVTPLAATAECFLLLLALLAHEFGHRILAHYAGGSHNEFMLWPAGGMIPPNAPPFPGPYFITHVGGIAANLLLALAAAAAFYFITYDLSALPLNPLAILTYLPILHLESPAAIAASLLYMFLILNLGIIIINLLPYYWFDGGPLLQSILWPFIKLYQAINVTCIVGMVLAVPLFFLALAFKSLLGMVMLALLFASSYSKRQQLKATGPQELEEAIAWSANYSGSDHTAARKKSNKRYAAAARKRAQAEQNEQAQIDIILIKVKEKGLHSLTYWEKRALKKATERQRQRDLAERR